MEKSDYPVVFYKGKRLLRVPEIAKPTREACAMCVFPRYSEDCTAIRHATIHDHPRNCYDNIGNGKLAGIYIPADDDEAWEKYVVAAVIRRIGGTNGEE
jgi:hypothetical protein